ncbi:hypothetical protein CL684_02435 [Candidatus Campbellbacteria bacterium]|nr:hypothetical protein [Candidatus Campbellbacteria bacterium]|tara:strand:- start:55 stop:1965 length:1911 start_codon:yes stop_codon:yes gene_type:complete
MIISRNWLQTYFDAALPDAQKIADDLLSHSFEIEGVIEKEADAVIDIDVLPNRAHDCLCHRGIAQEYAAINKLGLITDRYHYHENFTQESDMVHTDIQSPDQCFRYTARKISYITVGKSPAWLTQRLEVLGERSINNIVDATNYVMFDIGNPLHAFDADKVVGTITVRNAQQGEVFHALGGEEYELESSDLVIADEEGILALAGIKGGTKAEVNETTKSIIIESANFNPVTTRATARRLKLFTHASKRYENGITSEITPIALESASRLISDCAHADDITLHAVSDIYPNPERQCSVEVAHTHIEKVLGISLTKNEVEDILERLEMNVHEADGVYTINIPFLRQDIRIAEDIIEELGRMYGYENIPVQKLEDHAHQSVNPEVYVEHRIINFLIKRGFSELENYSFVKKGDQSVINPIASDKSALRKNLTKEMQAALALNTKQADFLNINTLKVFEIGTVYLKDSEQQVCTIAIEPLTKSARKRDGTSQDQLESLLTEMKESLDISIEPEFEQNMISFVLPNINTIDAHAFTELFKVRSYDDTDSYHSLSVYPYSKRDISLWAPEEYAEQQIKHIIQSAAGHILKKIYLFDTFTKEGRTSYAYNLIFQLDDDTLTDQQIENVMNAITKTLEKEGAEIR